MTSETFVFPDFLLKEDNNVLIRSFERGRANLLCQFISSEIPKTKKAWLVRLKGVDLIYDANLLAAKYRKLRRPKIGRLDFPWKNV